MLFPDILENLKPGPMIDTSQSIYLKQAGDLTA